MIATKQVRQTICAVGAALLGLATVIVAPTQARADFIVNGGFDSNAAGWTLGGSGCTSPFWNGSIGNPGGTVVLNFCGGVGSDPGFDPNASQTVSGLTVGQSYTLKWDQSLYDAANPTPIADSFGVYINSVLLTSNQIIGTTDGTWVTFTKTFIAASSSLTILFAAEMNNTDVSYKLDNVSLNATVPAPGALALLGLGLVGLGTARRRKAA